MEANDISSHKLDIIPQVWPYICQNTQAGSLQNHSHQILKNNNCDNFELCLKLSQTERINSLISNKIKQEKGEDLKRMNDLNLKSKKPNKSNHCKGQQLTEKLQSNILENCKKNHRTNNQKQSRWAKSNSDYPVPQRNQNYNTQQLFDKINFQQCQKKKSKNQKILVSKPVQISAQKLAQSLRKQNLSMFFNGSEIVYPIPDHIYQVTESYHTSTDILDSLKPKNLPMGFCFVLETLNLCYLFPQVFKIQQETILKLNQTLQAPLQFIENRLNSLLEQNFKDYLKLLSSFIIEDLSSQKLQTITDTRVCNILSLGKFSQQNQLFEFVFKYNWPLLLLQLAKMSAEQLKSEYHQYQRCIQFMKNNVQTKNYQIPLTFELRFEMISFLIDVYSRTNSFRELFNKKIESNRNVNKRKLSLQEQKKYIQQNIKKVQSNKQKKTKKITKKDKRKTKRNDEQSQEESGKQQLGNQNESMQKLQKQLDEVQEEIQKQNRQDSLSCCHYLGKDHNNQLFWYISYFPDKLFVQKTDSSWCYLNIDQAFHFTDCLNRKAINQNRLYEKVQQYYQSLFHKFQCKMEMETDQNTNQLRSKNLFQSSSTILEKNNSFYQKPEMELQNLIEEQQQNDSSKNSLQNSQLLVGLGAFRIDQDSLCRMIQLGEKKMTQYLKDRNSRWGSQENKQLLLSIIKGNGANWLQEAKRQISLFNQKICVVEIQYKVFVQQSVQQVDSKIKKIQTKIWGINEKYKHNWYDFINSCSSFTQLFFAVSVLYSLIKKYTSKHRKLRKEYEEIKQKTVWKSTSATKEWKQTWNQVCEVCGLTGEVLCCDFCPKVYHLSCVKLTQVPWQQFKCKSCKEQITTRNQLKSIANQGRKNNRK